MSNLTLSIDDALVKKARIKAIEEGTSLSAKVRELLTHYVQGPRSAALAVVPSLPVFAGKGGLKPGINPSSNKSMLSALDEPIVPTEASAAP